MAGRGMSGRGRQRGKGGARRETPQEARERMTRAHRAEARSRQPASDVGGAEERDQPARFADRPRPDDAPVHRSPVATTPDRREQADEPPASDSQDASAAELVKQLTEQTKTLVKQEMRLAQVELQEKGKKLGLGAGMFGAGGLVAFFGTAALIVALVLALSTALAPWLAALIVGVLLLAVAGGAAVMGKKQIEQATPPVPEQTVETVKEDVEHVKSSAKR